MALVKGANGVVFDAHEQIASGLVNGGHAVWVDVDGNQVDEPVTTPAETESDSGKGSKG
jgi:hypothetical protein